MKHFLSFVVIGKNIKSKVINCILSIEHVIMANSLRYYEIVYVDSKSSDGTIEELKKKFKDKIKIIVLTGNANSAIARNAGADNTSGDTIFFVDGDTEIQPAFVAKVYSEENGLVYPLVTGRLKDIYYDKAGNLIPISRNRYEINETRESHGLGGIFMITRNAFDKVKGFKNYLKISQDIDIGYRLQKAGIYHIAIPELMAHHHTVHYYDASRLYERFRSGVFGYIGVFYRANLLNKYCLLQILREQKLTFVFVGSLLLTFTIHWLFIFTLPLLIFIKSRRNKVAGFWQELIAIILRDLGVFYGLFFFYPNKLIDEHKKIQIR
jgi:glycosyltransferase involved in cell wall biosynthesis